MMAQTVPAIQSEPIQNDFLVHVAHEVPREMRAVPREMEGRASLEATRTVQRESTEQKGRTRRFSGAAAPKQS